MADFVQCPSCRGLLGSNRERCPHCDLLLVRRGPGRTMKWVVGLSAAVSTHVMACECYGVPIYNFCRYPDGGIAPPQVCHPPEEEGCLLPDGGVGWLSPAACEDARAGADAGSTDGGGEDAGSEDAGTDGGVVNV